MNGNVLPEVVYGCLGFPFQVSVISLSPAACAKSYPGLVLCDSTFGAVLMRCIAERSAVSVTLAKPSRTPACDRCVLVTVARFCAH